MAWSALFLLLAVLLRIFARSPKVIEWSSVTPSTLILCSVGIQFSLPFCDLGVAEHGCALSGGDKELFGLQVGGEFVEIRVDHCCGRRYNSVLAKYGEVICMENDFNACCGMSWRYQGKRMGDRTLTCGTPVLSTTYVEKSPS